MAAPFSFWQRHIRALLYGVQFDADPTVDASVDRAIRNVLNGAPPAGGNECLRAIEAALGDPADLSTLLPQPHSDAVVRSFLAAVAKKLRGTLA